MQAAGCDPHAPWRCSGGSCGRAARRIAVLTCVRRCGATQRACISAAMGAARPQDGAQGSGSCHVARRHFR
jgi:hypothetical protein